MITNGLPQEVMTSQYGCGALRTLQKIKFYKDTQVCMYVCTCFKCLNHHHHNNNNKGEKKEILMLM